MIKNKILVIGKKGYIASNLINFLKKKESNFRSIHFEKKKYFKVEKIIQTYKPSVIIPLFGLGTVLASKKNPYLSFDLNYKYYQKLLNFIHKKKFIKKIIIPSSSAVYKNSKKKLLENSGLLPKSVYGKHKLLMEKACKKINKENVQSLVILRIFSVYGPSLKKQIIYDAYRKFKSKKNLEFFGDGSEVRDFIHIDDLCSLYFFLINKKLLKKIYIFNVGTGVGIKINELITKISAYFNNTKFVFNRKKIDKTNKKLVANIGKLKITGWYPKKKIYQNLSKILISYEK